MSAGIPGSGSGGSGDDGGRGPGRARFSEIRRFGELDSTNRYLLDEARAGAPEGLVVVADHQTAGRGRLGRRWEAPAGANLLVSVLLRPTLPVEELHLSTVAMALATRAACGVATAGAVVPVLKWPNDVMVGERKLAGILAETIPGDPGGKRGESGRVVVVGLGLNVAWPPPDAPRDSPADGDPGPVELPEDLGPATSLWRESGIRMEPSRLLDLLLPELAHRLDELEDGQGRRRLAAEYREVCATLGRRVTVSLAEGPISGTVAEITAEGHLLLDLGACTRTITAGDVVHLRS
jgi:BirA family biotin operon repressor/biotin-[acetyl-CoA-carboxylase] ligase